MSTGPPLQPLCNSLAAAALCFHFTYFLVEESTKDERKQNQTGNIRKKGRGLLGISELIILKMGPTKFGPSIRDAVP